MMPFCNLFSGRHRTLHLISFLIHFNIGFIVWSAAWCFRVGWWNFLTN